MISKKISAYFSFARQCLMLLAGERKAFSLFVVLSVAGALSEGVSISLLVPLLDAHGGGSAFSNMPLFGTVSSAFADMTPSRRIAAVAVAMAIALIMRNLLQYFVEVLGAIVPLRL